ncbi:DoxX-like family protein [Psychrobacter vallis]|uniref:DoxX-like family protein n=1 Tax=Psychrobacter vallis TaxID=248451 RepID=UPI0019198926|nr:DoxX-like family protein [Psychrobacter vallis]
MQNSKLSHISFVSRLLLGFLFIYHGLVPKILWLSVVEIHLVSLSGFNLPANIVSPLAGIGEIILGCLIIFFRKSTLPVYIAAVALCLLLIFVGLASPEYLIHAFNPVTTNILGLGFCYLILFVDKNDNA